MNDKKTFGRLFNFTKGDYNGEDGPNLEFVGSILDWDFESFKVFFLNTYGEMLCGCITGSVQFVYYLDREHYIELNFCKEGINVGSSWVLKKGNETLEEKSYGNETFDGLMGYNETKFYNLIPKLDYFLGLI